MAERKNEVICTGDPRSVRVSPSGKEPVKIASVSAFDALLHPSPETIKQIEQEYT